MEALFSNIIELIQTYFSGVCSFRTQYQIYCPGCGGSRAAIALLQGDVLLSLKYNPITLLFLIDVLLMTGLDMLSLASKGKFRFLNVRLFYNVAFLLFIILYTILRNYMLIVCNIDWLGDFR